MANVICFFSQSLDKIYDNARSFVNNPSYMVENVINCHGSLVYSWYLHEHSTSTQATSASRDTLLKLFNAIAKGWGYFWNLYVCPQPLDKKSENVGSTAITPGTKAMLINTMAIIVDIPNNSLTLNDHKALCHGCADLLTFESEALSPDTDILDACCRLCKYSLLYIIRMRTIFYMRIYIYIY